MQLEQQDLEVSRMQSFKVEFDQGLLSPIKRHSALSKSQDLCLIASQDEKVRCEDPFWRWNLFLMIGSDLFCRL